jgi:transcriptional regulator with XRE-family HTH domain
VSPRGEQPSSLRAVAPAVGAEHNVAIEQSGEAVVRAEDALPASGLEESLATVIAERVREFRLRHGWTVGRLAEVCGLSKSMLSKIENAQTSPSLATLARLSEALAVPVTAFFRGLSEEQDVIFVKAGGGLDIRHRNSELGQRYQTLGTMRAPHDSLEPMLVTLTERTDAFPLYQHAGTELILMITGKMEYCYGGARYLLEAGDTLQFVGEVAHGPGELIALPIQFLAVKALGSRP